MTPISDGQAVNAAITNAAFLYKNTNDTSSGTLTLGGLNLTTPLSKASGGTGGTTGLSYASYASKTANYLLTTSDQVAGFDSTSGNLVSTFPTAVGNSGLVLAVLKTDSSANTVTVNTTSSQTVGPRASGNIVLAKQGDFVQVVSDNSNWQILGKREYKFLSSAPGATSAQSGSKYTTLGCTFTLTPGIWRVTGQFAINYITTTAANINFFSLSGFYGADGGNSTSIPTALGGTISGDVTWASQEATFIIAGGAAGNNSRMPSGWNQIIVTVTSNQAIFLVAKTDWSSAAFAVDPYMVAERVF